MYTTRKDSYLQLIPFSVKVFFFSDKLAVEFRLPQRVIRVSTDWTTWISVQIVSKLFFSVPYPGRNYS